MDVLIKNEPTELQNRFQNLSFFGPVETNYPSLSCSGTNKISHSNIVNDNLNPNHNFVDYNVDCELYKIIQKLKSFDSSTKNEIIDFINKNLETRNNLVVDNNESVVTGSKLSPKVNEYPSTQTTRVPTTESENVTIDTDGNTTRNLSIDIEQETKENTEDFVFSDYESFKNYANEVIDKYYSEVSNLHFKYYFDDGSQHSSEDFKCKSFFMGLDTLDYSFKGRVSNELKVLRCCIKDKEFFDDKGKQTQVINKLKMLPEITKEYKNLLLLRDELIRKFNRALKKSHDKKMKIFREIEIAASKEMLRVKEYNNKLYEIGFYTSLDTMLKIKELDAEDLYYETDV